ncbi:probable RNA polymerase II nuclear localization protein SLC7A6OS [Dendroctonus ponderosae]
MAAVVRIKRRLDEDPLETLVLNCKRRKTNGSDEAQQQDLSAVLRLAGTSQKEENIETLLRKHRLPDRNELKEQYKKHPVNISAKNRCDSQEASKNSRYKVVNCFRRQLVDQETSPELAVEGSSSSEVTVFDIETETSRPPVEANAEPAEARYVYDFYYTSSDDFGEADIQDSVSIHRLNDPVEFGAAEDYDLVDDASDEDTDDSNAENNWKNDYPEDDEFDSINEEDMVQAANKLNEDVLSSDSGEENFVYSQDELLYGKEYARFKAKHQDVKPTGMSNDFYYGDIDKDEQI